MPPQLERRVVLDVDLVGEAVFARLVQLIDAVALDVEFPAVIDAPETAFLVAPKEQRDPAVGTELVDKADPAVKPMASFMAAAVRLFWGKYRERTLLASSLSPKISQESSLLIYLCRCEEPSCRDMPSSRTMANACTTSLSTFLPSYSL